jgi:hypothetical protein
MDTGRGDFQGVGEGVSGQPFRHNAAAGIPQNFSQKEPLFNILVTIYKIFLEFFPFCRETFF